MTFFPEESRDLGPRLGPSLGLDLSRWRDRSLHRSLAGVRARSVERMERLVAATRELANETGSAAFTVQQVVARSGLSLKSFYACFRTKDDLLLALIEEDSSLGADILHAMIDAHETPVARLHAFFRGIFSLLLVPGAAGYAAVLVREQRRLTEHHTEHLRVALVPLVSLVEAELVAGTDAGVLTSAEPARDAATVFELVLSGIHDVVVGADARDPLEVAEYLWRFCSAGLRSVG